MQEAARGLPVTPFMSDLTDDVKVARLQAAFVAGIVLPLWRAAAARFSGLDEPLANLAATLAHFEALRSAKAPALLADEAAAAGPAAAPQPTTDVRRPAEGGAAGGLSAGGAGAPG